MNLFFFQQMIKGIFANIHRAIHWRRVLDFCVLFSFRRTWLFWQKTAVKNEAGAHEMMGRSPWEWWKEKTQVLLNSLFCVQFKCGTHVKSEDNSVVRSLFSFMWVWGIEFRSSVCTARALPIKSSCQPPEYMTEQPTQSSFYIFGHVWY